jgi:hypothetical protein
VPLVPHYLGLNRLLNQSLAASPPLLDTSCM